MPKKLTPIQRVFLTTRLRVDPYPKNQNTAFGRDSAKINQAFNEYSNLEEEVVEAVADIEDLEPGAFKDLVSEYRQKILTIQSRVKGTNRNKAVQVMTEARTDLERIKNEVESNLKKRALTPDGLESLKAELVRVETEVVKKAGATKPAILAGKFKYAESVLSSTTLRLSQNIDKGLVKPVEEVRMLAEKVRQELTEAREKQVERSLEKLSRVASKFKEEAATLGIKLKQCAGDEPSQVKARNLLYSVASETLAELSRELADWQGQVKEAKELIKSKAGEFQKQLELLTKAEEDIDKVVEGCLPKMKSSVAGSDYKPDDTGAEIETIKEKEELDALKACGNSWVNAKQKYGANKDEMQKLANYRKERVDEWLKKTLPPWEMEEGPGKGWVSVGSADPTSDYDISLNKHGKKDKEIRMDYQFVQDFNAWFRKEFHGEGGTVFDTNLYASAPPLVKEDGPGAKSTHDVAALMKMRRYMTSGEFEEFRVETAEACGDDFNRRMEVEQQFALADSNYRIVVTELLENGYKMLKKRTEERDKRSGELDSEEKRLQSLEKAGLADIAGWLEKGKVAKGIEAYSLIEEGEEYLRVIEHLLKDSSLETTNEMYAEKIGQVRGQEMVAKLMQDLNLALNNPQINKKSAVSILQSTRTALSKIERTKDDKGNPLFYESSAIDKAIAAIGKSDESAFKTAIEEVKKQIEAETGERLSQLGTSNVISRFFANEAYQADGPFAHIVTATQAAEADALNELAKGVNKDVAGHAKDEKLEVRMAMTAAGGVDKYGKLTKEEQGKLVKNAQTKMGEAVAKEKKLRQDKLPPEECLQSFNEQLGDFLKDLEHYGEDEPGKAIIQSSKYLERLLDATRLMADKGLVKESDIPDLENQLRLQDTVKKELIAARKGNLMMKPLKEGDKVDQQEERRAYACEFMKKLGVNSISALAKKYVKFGVKVNAAARKALANIK